jgi:hypothetical protein
VAALAHHPSALAEGRHASTVREGDSRALWHAS